MTDMPDTTTTAPESAVGAGGVRRRRRRLLHAGRPDPRHQGARRPARGALEHPPVRGPHRQPRQPAPALGDRGRHRPGRRQRRRHAGRGGVRREVLLLPGLPAPRPLDRSPGRHQRRQELQGRRRLRLPALLRHHQGRRLPLARVQRLPAGPGQRQHHRPVRRAGRAVRPRVRRPARQPLLRRRPGLAHLLRPRPDRPAAADRRLPGARAPGRRRHRAVLHPPRDGRARSSSTAGPAGSSCATWSPARSRPTSPTWSCSPPAATATSSSSPPTRWAATSPRPGGRTARAPTWPTRATRRSTRRASRSPGTTSPSSR